MREILKTILFVLVAPAVTFAFYYTLLSLRQPLPTFEFGSTSVLVTSIIAAFFTWLAILQLNGILHNRNVLALTKKVKLEDGKRAVISGRVVAEDQLLEAPCSGSKCVVYRYTVSHHHTPENGPSRWIDDYNGFAITRCVVKGSIHTVSLLATPLCLERYHNGTLLGDPVVSGSEAIERISKYVEQTDFEHANDKKAEQKDKTKLSNLKPGNFRIDTVARSPRPITDASQLSEWVISEGDRVLIDGIYQADRKGIGPGKYRWLERLTIVPGGEEKIKSQIASYIKIVKVTITLAALTCAIYFFIIYG